MINFRWVQAAGQASGLNLPVTQAISRGLRKGDVWGWGVRVCVCEGGGG